MSADRCPVLTDDEVESTSCANLRAAYRVLRDRHVREKMKLVVLIGRMRPVYERAVDWRTLATPASAQDRHARLCAAIDAALAAEAQE